MIFVFLIFEKNVFLELFDFWKKHFLKIRSRWEEYLIDWEDDIRQETLEPRFKPDEEVIRGLNLIFVGCKWLQRRNKLK